MCTCSIAVSARRSRVFCEDDEPMNKHGAFKNGSNGLLDHGYCMTIVFTGAQMMRMFDKQVR